MRPLLITLLISCMLYGPVSGQPVTRPAKSRGITAYPFPAEVPQPDGTRITLAGRGDGVIHWYETPDGYTVLKDKTGSYNYAVKDSKGDLVPSGSAVGDIKAAAPAGIEKHLGFSPAQVEAFSKSWLKEANAKANPINFPSTGTNNVLMIMIEYPDQPANIAPSGFEDLMNTVNYDGTGSFRDYYLGASFGQLTLETTVTAWVQVSQPMSYYGGNDAYGFDLHPRELVREALDLLEAGGFDFSPFDNNGDGYVDDLIACHAGYGEEFPGAGDTCIWSHSWELGPLSVVYDGLAIDNYTLVPELRENTGSGITHIGVICHEFGHSLGLPDFYDTDGDGSGGYAWDLMFWDLMADGSWVNDGISPVNVNAWSKEFLGWMNIPDITAPGAYSLQAAAVNPEAYRIRSATYNEYFIIENRQQTGPDLYLPENGMLIYHADMNYAGWQTHAVNADPSHQGFDLEEADDIRDYDTFSGDPFPGSSNNQEFSTASVPSSDDWSGQPTRFALQDITLTGDVISFNVLDAFPDALPPAWTVDPAAYTYSGKITAVVLLDRDTADAGYLAAFSGTECRGIANTTFYPDSNRYVFDLICYSNMSSEDTLSFAYYDAAGDSVYSIAERIGFIPDMDQGSFDTPVALHHYIQFSSSFVTGWNWLSINVVQNDMSIGTILSTGLSTGDYIKNQTISATYYDGYGWYGTITELDPVYLYKFRVLNGLTMEMEGNSINAAAVPITVVPGWNWIGFLPKAPVPIADALASLTLTTGDYIKNQTRSATWYSGYGWYGQLAELVPGEGYMLRVSTGSTLLYPDAPAPVAKKAAVNSAPIPLKSDFDPHAYEFNGSVTARVNIGDLPAGSPEDLLLAFAGDRCRGIARGSRFEPSGSTLFPLMIHSNANEGETITFRYFSAEKDQFFPLNGTLEFRKDMVTGDAFRPFDLYVEEVTDLQEYPGYGTVLLQVGPNPFRDQLRIEYTVTTGSEITLAIYDIYGKLVRELSRGYAVPGSYVLEWQAADCPAGTYIVRMSGAHGQVMKRILKIE